MLKLYSKNKSTHWENNNHIILFDNTKNKQIKSKHNIFDSLNNYSN